MTAFVARIRSLFEQHPHLFKYLLIGATASAIDLSLFLVLFNVVGTSDFFAHAISVPTSVIFSFVVNARHNFKTSDHGLLRFAAFVAVCSLGFVTGYAVIAAVAQTGLGANIGKIVSLPVVFVLQYLLNRSITFRPVDVARA